VLVRAGWAQEPRGTPLGPPQSASCTQPRQQLGHTLTLTCSFLRYSCPAAAILPSARRPDSIAKWYVLRLLPLLFAFKPRYAFALRMRTPRADPSQALGADASSPHSPHLPRSPQSYVAAANFQYILRILNTNVDGRRSEYALHSVGNSR
jgi:hypothetical protein